MYAAWLSVIVGVFFVMYALIGPAGRKTGEVGMTGAFIAILLLFAGAVLIVVGVIAIAVGGFF